MPVSSARSSGPIVLDFSLVAPGGSWSHASGFLAALADHDGRVDDLLVALPGRDDVLGREEAALRAAGIRVERIGTRRGPGTLASHLSGQVSLPLLVRRERPSMVFVPREVAPLLLPRPIVLLAANVLRWRRPDPTDPGVARRGARGRIAARVRDTIARAAVGRALVVVAPSRVIGDMLPGGTGVEVIPFGVDVEPVAAIPARPLAVRPLRLVSLGTISRHKRIDVIIDVAAALNDHHGVPAVLDIWGGISATEDEHRVRSRLEACLGDRGRLRGVLAPADRRTVLAEADVLVLGSGTESFGFPMLEAMRTGTLVVAPDSPIAREIGAGHIVTFPEAEPEAAAQGVVNLLGPERVGEAVALLTRALEWSSGFTWERCVDETLTLLRDGATVRR